jgi:hypothetical protein
MMRLYDGFWGLSGVFALLLVMILSVGFAETGFARQTGMLVGSHGDRSLMPKTCRSCHKGMTMALSGEESSCFACHADSTRRSAMVTAGYLKGNAGSTLADIEAELRKPYNHPTLTIRGVHRQLETLPEEIVNAARHAECVDCHNPHLTDSENPYRGIKGRRVVNLITDIVNEYELCYRCHAESANLPGNSSNKHEEFKTTNTSFHPVEGEGKNTFVISLKDPYVAQKQKPKEISQISCSDCHGSDAPGSPKGPHGSNNPGLLSLNYQMDDERSESEQAYALCYKCHDRSSILSNESFPYHSLHIQGQMGGLSGASCFTCHDAHGSAQYQHLIKFNEDVVFENADRKLKYEAQGYSARHGACYLNCHGVEHNPLEY